MYPAFNTRPVSSVGYKAYGGHQLPSLVVGKSVTGRKKKEGRKASPYSRPLTGNRMKRRRRAAPSQRNKLKPRITMYNFLHNDLSKTVNYTNMFQPFTSMNYGKYKTGGPYATFHHHSKQGMKKTKKKRRKKLKKKKKKKKATKKSVEPLMSVDPPLKDDEDLQHDGTVLYKQDDYKKHPRGAGYYTGEPNNPVRKKKVRKTKRPKSALSYLANDRNNPYKRSKYETNTFNGLNLSTSSYRSKIERTAKVYGLSFRLKNKKELRRCAEREDRNIMKRRMSESKKITPFVVSADSLRDYKFGEQDDSYQDYSEVDLDIDVIMYKRFVSTTLNRYRQIDLLQKVLKHIPNPETREEYCSKYDQWEPVS